MKALCCLSSLLPSARDRGHRRRPSARSFTRSTDMGERASRCWRRSATMPDLSAMLAARRYRQIVLRNEGSPIRYARMTSRWRTPMRNRYGGIGGKRDRAGDFPLETRGSRLENRLPPRVRTTTVVTIVPLGQAVAAWKPGTSTHACCALLSISDFENRQLPQAVDELRILAASADGSPIDCVEAAEDLLEACRRSLRCGRPGGRRKTRAAASAATDP